MSCLSITRPIIIRNNYIELFHEDCLKKMPREDRRIHFENEEVYKALYALCFQKQLKQPPPGNISFIKEDDSKSQIIISLENPHDKTAANLEYSQDFLAAALMLFCRGSGIPLPKSAKKSVMLVDGQVILRVQV